MGNFGSLIGSAFWELLCLEHGIHLDGTVNLSKSEFLNAGSFFSESIGQRFVPRATFFDTDSTTIESQIKLGNLTNLFNSNQFVTGKDSCSTVSKIH